MYKCSQRFAAVLWVLFCSLNYWICYLYFSIKLINVLSLNLAFTELHMVYHRLFNGSKVYFMMLRSEDSL